MNKKRLLSLGIAWIGGFALIVMMALFFQVPGALSQEVSDSGLESDKAIAAEQGSPVVREVESFDVGGTFPLFVGLDDDTVPTFVIDPATNMSQTAFVGAEVWGAAYDPVNDRVYIADGITLLQWDVGGAVSTLGTMTNGAGGNLSVVGMAFYNGTLYGYTASQTEGIWIIDPATQIGTLHIATVAADTDCGGLAADPSDGTFYCTSDDTSGPGGAGLYIVNGDGSLTLVSSYPAGQTDVDGLTVGTDGVAYLITDGPFPEDIFRYDLVAGAYITPLNSPFTTTEIFAGGAWIEPAASGPGISMEKTVGTDVNSCAATNAITVTQGTQVTYCYNVTNTGTFTLFWHDLVDSQLGTILNGFFFPLGPGTSAFVTDTTFIFNTTVNTATWTACNQAINQPGEGFDCGSGNAIDVVSSTDSATVFVQPPSIDFTKTVGTDPNACAGTNSITVDIGTDVTYCYAVTNTGGMTLTVHDLDDSELGTILSGFPFTLTPGASVFLTQSVNIVTDTNNVATWTACNIDGAPSLTCSDGAAFDVVSDTDSADVFVNPPIPVNPGIEMTKTVGTSNAACATTDNISVGSGTEVYYCYTVMNTGDVTLTVHDLDDDKLGTILSGFAFDLGPGESTAVFPVSATITGTVTNVATWTAYIVMPTYGPVMVTSTDSATVTETPTAVSLNSFDGTSNSIVLPVMVGILGFLVLVAGYVIRRMQPESTPE